MSETLYPTLGTGARVLKLLKSTEDFGGPQSIDDVCQNLGMNNRNARSILSRLYLKGKIDRIGKATYRIKGDSRDFDPDKPHHK